jgi:protein-S-isoprenylcysteine O-methyltransferase Ste14
VRSAKLLEGKGAIMDQAMERGQAVRRTAGWVFGAGAQLAFAATVVRLYQFLASSAHPTQPQTLWFATDVALAMFFAVPHSVVRLPRVQKAISQRIGREFFGAFYCWMTCLSLGVVFICWRSSAVVVWHLKGVAGAMMFAAFLASWAALAYSLCLTGVGYQTGFTEWNHWRRRQPVPQRRFEPRGAYKWLRHPVYLSFAGLIWFHPVMTLDYLTLAIAWTAYIAVGSYLKDERLAFYMGDHYRRYQERVPGYPLLIAGPLGLRRTSTSIPATPASTSTAAA